MKIKLKTVKNEEHEVEADPTNNVGQLKEIIAKKLDVDKAWITLILAGQQMADDKLIESYNIQNYLVLFIKKPRVAATKPSQTAETPAPGQPEPEKSTPTPSSATPAQAPAPQTTQTPSTPSAPQQGDDSIFFDQERFQATVNQISEMGFPKEQVALALRASFNNPDRAVEYLMSGNIPAIAQPRPQQPTAQPSSQPSPQPTNIQQPAQPNTATGATGEPDVFAMLRQHPQFPQLCAIAQEGGQEALKHLLQYFAQSQPDLLAYIAQHQQEFIDLLNTPIPQDAAPARVATPTGPGGQRGPRRIQITLTPDQEQIVNNFVAMGFDRRKVLEAYVLFEKDEQMTAEYLLNSPPDEDD